MYLKLSFSAVTHINQYVTKDDLKIPDIIPIDVAFPKDDLKIASGHKDKILFSGYH